MKALITFLILIPTLLWGQGYRPFVCNYYVSTEIAGKHCDGSIILENIFSNNSIQQKTNVH